MRGSDTIAGHGLTAGVCDFEASIRTKCRESGVKDATWGSMQVTLVQLAGTLSDGTEG
jgi:hypothetical protein